MIDRDAFQTNPNLDAADDLAKLGRVNPSQLGRAGAKAHSDQPRPLGRDPVPATVYGHADGLRIEPETREAWARRTPAPAKPIEWPAPSESQPIERAPYVDPWAAHRELARQQYFPSREESKKRIAALDVTAKATGEAHQPVAREHERLEAEAEAARTALVALNVRIVGLDAQIANHDERQVELLREGKPIAEIAAEVQTFKARRQTLVEQRPAHEQVAREAAARVKAHLPKFDESTFKAASARLQLERERAKAEIAAALEPVASKMEKLIAATRASELEALAPYSGMHLYDRLRRSLGRDDLGAWFAAGLGMLLR